MTRKHLRSKKNEVDVEQKSPSTPEPREPTEIAYPEQYRNEYLPFIYLASPFVITIFFELIKNLNDGEEVFKNTPFSKIFAFVYLFYGAYERATRNNDQLIDLYSETFDMIENEKIIIFELMKTNHDKAYRFNAKHAERFIDDVFNEIAKNFNVSLTSRYPKDSFYIFDFTPINAMILFLNTIHENNEIIAILGLAKAQLEHKYLEIEHAPSASYPKKPELELKISANILNYSRDQFMLVRIEKFTPYLRIDSDTAVYLENLPIDKIIKLSDIPPLIGNHSIEVVFTKNHEAFIIPKYITDLEKENEFHFQLSEEDEEMFSAAQEQKHSTPSFKFFSKTNNSTVSRNFKYTHADISEDTDKYKRKEKIKTRPAILDNPSSEKITFLDEKKSEPDTIKILRITFEEKSKDKTRTSEKDYILHLMSRYAPDLDGIKAVYAFFSSEIENEKKIRDDLSLYKRALSGKVGNHRCTLKKYAPPKGKQSDYTLKIKLFYSGIEDPGQIRILGRTFKILEDPEVSNKSIMIMAFDCIQNKKTDNLTVKTDPWLDKNKKSYQITDIKVKTVNIEEPSKDRHGKQLR